MPETGISSIANSWQHLRWRRVDLFSAKFLQHPYPTLYLAKGPRAKGGWWVRRVGLPGVPAQQCWCKGRGLPVPRRCSASYAGLAVWGGAVTQTCC